MTHAGNSTALSRRAFIRLTGVAAASVAAATATRAVLESPAAGQGGGVAVAVAPIEDHWVRTTCAMCPSGCGLEVRVANGKAVKVEGNALHPVNQGVCCLRGHASLEALYSPERIQRPRIQMGEKGGGDWREISWDEALTLVVEKLREVEPHTAAFLHGDTRGSMRGLIQRFMHGFGSPNVVSLETAGEHAARSALLLSQGINGYPVYDLNNAAYAMAFGGNLLETGRHVMTALGAVAFMRRGRPERGKFVHVHPRLGLTAVKADEWVPIRPGTYAALALGMANVIINSGLYDAAFVRDFTFGFEDFADAEGREHIGFKRHVLENYPLTKVEDITGVPASTIARLAGEFATNRPAIAVLPTEEHGLTLYEGLAVHALNALVGSIDGKGGVLTQRFPQLAPFPPGAEQVSVAGRVPLPITAGFDPLAPVDGDALADRLLSSDPYPVNALFLYNANPVYSLASGGRVAGALLKIPFVVSFASTLDESASHANLILPASTFLESWGDDFVEGTGYAGISLRQPVVDAVHDTRDPGDVLLDLAHRLGGTVAQSLPYQDYRDLVEQRIAPLNLDAGKLAENGVWSEMVYFNAEPGSVAWSMVVGRDRLNAPKDGRFDFFSRELLAVTPHDLPVGAIDGACLPHFEAPPPAEDALVAAYPFLLVSQGLITQPRGWQGILPTLQECYGLQSNERWRTWVEINPKAAAPLRLVDGDRVWIESPAGKVQATVRLYEGIWPNAIYLPPGLGHRTLVRWGYNSPSNSVVGANAATLRDRAVTTRVKITKA